MTSPAPVPATVLALVGAGRGGTTLLYKLLALHRDVAYLSNYQQRAPGWISLARLSALIRDRHDCGKHRLRAGLVLGARYMELRDEHLLRDPEARLRRVCAFIGLDLVPRMTTLERPSENLGQSTGSTRIESGNLGRFAQHMPLALSARIEAVAGAAMREFGYELSQQAQAPRRLFRPRLWFGWRLIAKRRRCRRSTAVDECIPTAEQG